MHRPCLTYPSQHQCGLSVYYFLIFKYQNLCICIMFSKSICSTKEHWWSLTSSWPDEVQRMFYNRPWAFKYIIDTTDDFHEMFLYVIDMTLTWLCFIYYTWRSIQIPRLLDYELPLFIYIYHLLNSLTKLLSAHARMFHTLQVNLRLVSRSGGAATSSWCNIKV